MPDLPAGTVTFLFTDIEGSTRLWETAARGMEAALARHDALLREVIEGAGGRIFKTVGDAFCAAFPTAPDALAAALAAQRRISATSWEEIDRPLRVRMALHTGAAAERDGDYFGPPLNRVARLLSTGHGGQVLLSTATQELARDSLPDGAILRDLGEHRLKDLQRPERIFQLAAPDLPRDFPPLRSLDAYRHNLPIQPTPLVGREREVAAVHAMLGRDDGRLLTLTGPGGTGKTRLGLQVAAEMIDAFRDGVFFVALASLRDPALVISAINQALGLQEERGRDPAGSLGDYLRERHVLLVLDNFEQVLEAAPLVAQLLSSSPGLKVVATSRAALRVRGEREFDVPPLALPDPRHPPTLERLTEYEAVRLFIERAQDVKPGFAVTNENAPAVAEICVRLDGLPLAIELAAARIKLLPPQAMLSKLHHRLQLLTGGARDLPAHQQTLRATIGWSHDLLDPEAQKLFRRLSVFIGGCTLESAETVCGHAESAPGTGGDEEMDLLDGLTALVNGSLLRQEEEELETGEPRFRMLETIREYALERLAESGEGRAIERGHAEHYLAFAERAEPAIRGGSEQIDWLNRVEREYDNLRAALKWWSTATDGAAAGLRMAGALSRFWWVHGRLTEGSAWLERALSRGEGEPDSVRADALRGAADLAFFRGQLERSRAWAEAALEASRRVKSLWRTARSLLALQRVALALEEYEQAERLSEEGFRVAREAGDDWTVASFLNNRGERMRQAGDYERARGLYEESLALNKKVGNWIGQDINLNNLGQVTLAQGDTAAAARFYREGLSLSLRTGKREGMAGGLEGLAAVLGARGELESAARIYGAAEALRESIGYPLEFADRPPYERSVAAVREALGDEAFAASWARGRALPLEEAIAWVLEATAGAS